MTDTPAAPVASPSPFSLEMKFDPRTVEHLGVRMYSTLPPALAELISNAYDADAGLVTIKLSEISGVPASVSIFDDGCGMSLEDINNKFLIIGRNRRQQGGDGSTVKFGRLPTGKKGLGKLAIFGLAKTIEVTTCKEGMKNKFKLDWNDLMASGSIYRPQLLIINESTPDPDGTTIDLGSLKRKSPFDVGALADSISRMFVFNDNFKVTLSTDDGDQIAINNKRKYETVKMEFSWKHTQFIPSGSPFEGKVTGEILTSAKPIPPGPGLRGITLFSRGKMVNRPEFFAESASSHFFQYLTGWLEVDFIDTLDEDVISTNRQSLDWENPKLEGLRKFLYGVVAEIGSDWRRKRKEAKDEELKGFTGIDTEKWIATLPEEIKEKANAIVNILSGEDALEKFTPVIKALHGIIPEYPLLHWRHLHREIKDRVRTYYTNQQYGEAADQGAKIYCEVIRGMTGRTEDGLELINAVFNERTPLIKVTPGVTETEKSRLRGQADLSRGLVAGFRNPMAHAPMDATVPAMFSELDCLNVLSLVSFLLTRLDGATVVATSPSPIPAPVVPAPPPPSTP